MIRLNQGLLNFELKKFLQIDVRPRTTPVDNIFYLLTEYILRLKTWYETNQTFSLVKDEVARCRKYVENDKVFSPERKWGYNMFLDFYEHIWDARFDKSQDSVSVILKMAQKTRMIEQPWILEKLKEML